MQQPTTPESQDVTLEAATPEDLDFNTLGLTRVALVVSNTGDTNPITSVKVAVSLDGTNFSAELVPVRLAVGTIDDGESSKLIDLPVRAKKLRVTLESTVGTDATVAMLGSTGTTDVETRVGGQLIGGESISGALSAATLQASSLTAGRVPLVGTDGLLEDDAGLTYNKSTDTLAVTGKATLTGDVEAAGGYRQQVGPFYVTTAADQTAVGTKLGDTVSQTWVAPFAGSVVGASGMIDAAVTGSGKSIKVRVYKNGSLLNAALDLDFTQAGGEVKDYATAAKDTYTFAAGDTLKLVYTTDTITNTPKFTGSITVEC